ncbi:putative kinetoplast-associated protein kap [Erysiphe neolycopersici]|uniref:Putative kinetoplast-associated protein kap n=1 Tax=Erysiphe neolycopersici TaxID=212602 RepID=A0A420HYR1_9PEZI|nr:putative kinetoplast-associated protein kap [Erysiphe neolycopersici]
MRENSIGSTVTKTASNRYYSSPDEIPYLDTPYSHRETRMPTFFLYSEHWAYFNYSLKLTLFSLGSRSPQPRREHAYQDRPHRPQSQLKTESHGVHLRVRSPPGKPRPVSTEPEKMAHRNEFTYGHSSGPPHETTAFRRPNICYVPSARVGYQTGNFDGGHPNNYPVEQTQYVGTTSRAPHLLPHANPHTPPHLNHYTHLPPQPQAHQQSPYYQNIPEQTPYMSQPPAPNQMITQPPPPATIKSMAMVQPNYESFAPQRPTALVPSTQFNSQWQESEMAKMKAEMEKQQREIAMEKAAREAKEKEEEERKKKAEEEAKYLRDIEDARQKEREAIERQRKAEEEARQATAKAIQEATIKAQKELEDSIRRRQEEERLAREKEQEQREKIIREFEEKVKREAEAKEAEAQRKAKEKQELEQRIKLERENAAREAEEKQRAELAAQKAEAEREAARQAAIDKRIEEEKKAAAAKALEQQKAKQEREAKLAAEKAAEEKRLQDVQAEYDRLRKTAADERAKLIEENAKAKKEGEENAKKALKASEEAIAKLMAPDKKKVIKFKDALGRKFSFPLDLCKTWQGMDDLIQQAFKQVPMFRSAVQSHFYDLIGPTGEIILPQLWDTTIEPDFSITMQMWAMDDKLKAPTQGTPSAQAPPPPPPPPRPAAPAKPRRRAAEPKRSVGVLGWVAGRSTRPTRGSR